MPLDGPEQRGQRQRHRRAKLRPAPHERRNDEGPPDRHGHGEAAVHWLRGAPQPREVPGLHR
eukprot:7397415-Lingulodinium_polyedra.AAC.1